MDKRTTGTAPPNLREIKETLYEEFARLGRAVSSPRRLELLDLLCQGERSVESLAKITRMGVTNTSQHLQTLRGARLVDVRKHGTRSLYSVSDPKVCRFLYEMQHLARGRLAEVDRIAHTYFEAREEFEPISRDDLLKRLGRRDTLVLDVRPAEEYEAGHIPGAISIPLRELQARLGDLPPDTEIVAYCRGPFCVLAPEALAILRTRGLRARRLEHGFPEWRAAGNPIEIGAPSQ